MYIAAALQIVTAVCVCVCACACVCVCVRACVCACCKGFTFLSPPVDGLLCGVCDNNRWKCIAE